MTAQDLMQAARAMCRYSYVPYSQFTVGAALESEDGTVFTGCNVENAAYGACICAERSAVVKAVSEGQRRFRRIAIAASGDAPCWPCGACRQVLAEFSPGMSVLVSNSKGEVTAASLSALLPHHFGPETLAGAD